MKSRIFYRKLLKLSKSFANDFLKDYNELIGMKHLKTNLYTPPQNRVARTWISSSGLVKKLWGEAISTAANTLN